MKPPRRWFTVLENMIALAARAASWNDEMVISEQDDVRNARSAPSVIPSRSGFAAHVARETTKERWFEAEVHRVAGDIALMSPRLDAAKAKADFERALATSRAQKTKSWELRAAISMARLWRDQDKRTEARDLLAPIYGWFTEGFGMLDLKEAKALLDELG